MSDARDEGQAPSDQELVAAAQGGDLEAFDAIVRRYHDRVFRLAHGITDNPSEAEEITQEVFLNIFRGLDAFRGTSSLRSWLHQVAVNTALMRLRSKRRKPQALHPGSKEHAPWNDAGSAAWSPGAWCRQPSEALLSRELGEHIAEAAANLSERLRLVLLLVDVEGLSYHEAAEALGVTVPTVKSRLHRARLFVRGEIDKYFRTH